jgi:hypothetical protein
MQVNQPKTLSSKLFSYFSNRSFTLSKVNVFPNFRQLTLSQFNAFSLKLTFYNDELVKFELMLGINIFVLDVRREV